MHTLIKYWNNEYIWVQDPECHVVPLSPLLLESLSLERSCHCAPLHDATSVTNLEVLAMLLALYKEPHANSSCPRRLRS